eukprot:628547_1
MASDTVAADAVNSANEQSEGDATTVELAPFSTGVEEDDDVRKRTFLVVGMRNDFRLRQELRKANLQYNIVRKFEFLQVTVKDVKTATQAVDILNNKLRPNEICKMINDVLGPHAQIDRLSREREIRNLRSKLVTLQKQNSMMGASLSSAIAEKNQIQAQLAEQIMMNTQLLKSQIDSAERQQGRVDERVEVRPASPARPGPEHIPPRHRIERRPDARFNDGRTSRHERQGQLRTKANYEREIPGHPREHFDSRETRSLQFDQNRGGLRYEGPSRVEAMSRNEPLNDWELSRVGVRADTRSSQDLPRIRRSDQDLPRIRRSVQDNPRIPAALMDEYRNPADSAPAHSSSQYSMDPQYGAYRKRRREDNLPEYRPY